MICLQNKKNDIKCGKFTKHICIFSQKVDFLNQISEACQRYFLICTSICQVLWQGDCNFCPLWESCYVIFNLISKFSFCHYSTFCLNDLQIDEWFLPKIEVFVRNQRHTNSNIIFSCTSFVPSQICSKNSEINCTFATIFCWFFFIILNVI